MFQGTNSPLHSSSIEPIFSCTYVFWYLHSTVMFPGTYFSQYLFSLVHMFVCYQVQIFSGTYILCYLCFPVLIFSNTYFHNHYVPRYIFSLPLRFAGTYFLLYLGSQVQILPCTKVPWNLFSPVLMFSGLYIPW